MLAILCTNLNSLYHMLIIVSAFALETINRAVLLSPVSLNSFLYASACFDSAINHFFLFVVQGPDVSHRGA